MNKKGDHTSSPVTLLGSLILDVPSFCFETSFLILYLLTVRNNTTILSTS